MSNMKIPSSRHRPFVSVASTVATIISLTSLLLLTKLPHTQSEYFEADRIKEHLAKNYTWPPTYIPPTEGWEALLSRRFDQIAAMHTASERWEGYMQVVNSAFVVPNFTTNGWGLTRAPDDLVAELRTFVEENLHRARPEHKVPVIEGGIPPTFIDNRPLMSKVLETLLPMHEKWAGVPLKGNNAYGFRLYHNQSYLNMHVDKPATHVISCILHVDRSDDAEPWPLVIEDLQGNTNEVLLEPGDILFYESAKCLHGRPKTFTGSWYTSVFVHYYPVDWNINIEDARIAVPLHWNQPPSLTDNSCLSVSDGEDKTCEVKDELVMVGTSMKEPNCPDRWCALSRGSRKWKGPAKKDYVITTDDVFEL